ncbi:MAG: nucleoside hydrolase [Bacteroidaceae bacterium]|nr:nucleoside hydrolase [Bacteroidaceae bacterium]
MRTFLLLILLCMAQTMQASHLIIFETDMGNDVDDAWALDMLHKYADEGRARILAVMLNKEGVGPCQYVELLNTWYGRPKIAVGRAVKKPNITGGIPCFPDTVAAMKDASGNPLYPHRISRLSDCPDAVTLYRRLLSKQKDHSVTIVSVGFSGNLAALLHSEADQYSPLSGRELVTRKVKGLVVMAGHISDPHYREFNVLSDIPSCQEVFSSWPTDIVVTPFELGQNAQLPAACLREDFGWTEHHPVLDGIKVAWGEYRDYPTWDMTGVLYAVEGCAGYFTLSAPGTITVTPEGCTHYVADSQGRHRYLMSDHNQRKLLVEHMRRMVSRKPKNKN